ncbi:MAG: hypothetical protein ACLFQR_06200 [Desulfovibrionales bacterium]
MKPFFADEPTISLDKTTGDAIVGLLKEINRTGITVVMVTHETEYRRLADQVIEMEDERSSPRAETDLMQRTTVSVQ